MIFKILRTHSYISVRLAAVIGIAQTKLVLVLKCHFVLRFVIDALFRRLTCDFTRRVMDAEKLLLLLSSFLPGNEVEHCLLVQIYVFIVIC